MRSGALTAAREKRESVESRGGRGMARTRHRTLAFHSNGCAVHSGHTNLSGRTKVAKIRPRADPLPIPQTAQMYTVRAHRENIIHFTCMATLSQV